MIDYKDVGDKYDEIIEFNRKAIQELTTALRDCRNELCYYCRQNTNKFNGTCKGCRWRDEDWND